MVPSSFSSLALPASMLANLESLGYREMTEIQARSLPLQLEGRDLIAKAKTGSGKTAAFSLGMLLKLEAGNFTPQALVLCPTRELATQVAKEIRRLARYRHNIKVLTLCGGQPIGPQIGSLAHGAHVIVGTPGRVQDHLRKGTLTLSEVHTLVLDEADRMLDMGFVDSIEAILQATPASRQTLLFSATYPDPIRQLSKRFQRDPVEVTVESVHRQSRLRQRFYRVESDHKLEALACVLSQYRPESAVIFCNTKQRCEEVAAYLNGQSLNACALHGDMEQKERDQALTRFAHRSLSLLVATDVAARGLDIEELPAVVNFDLSRDSKVYIHRIGRTGRAGREGLALSLFGESERYKLEAIAEDLDQPLEQRELSLQPPDPDYRLIPPMVDLCINAGRKQKLRPGDILGALTGDAGIAADRVGKITLFDQWAYVAVERSIADKALGRLLNGKIKGRKLRVRKL